MTPNEVRELTIPEYLAFSKLMDDHHRELARQARKRGRHG